MTVHLSLVNRFKPAFNRSPSLPRRISRFRQSLTRRTHNINSRRSSGLTTNACPIRALKGRFRNISIRSKINLIRSYRLQIRRPRLGSLITLTFATKRTLVRTTLNRQKIRIRVHRHETRLLRPKTRQQNFTPSHNRQNTRRIQRQRAQCLRQMLRHRRRTNPNSLISARIRRIFTIRNSQTTNSPVNKVPYRNMNRDQLSKPIKARSNIHLATSRNRIRPPRSLLKSTVKLSLSV